MTYLRGWGGDPLLEGIRFGPSAADDNSFFAIDDFSHTRILGLSSPLLVASPTGYHFVIGNDGIIYRGRFGMHSVLK